MNLGKLIKRNGQLYIRDLTSEALHASAANPDDVGQYFSYEINEDDDAVDLLPACEALLEAGIKVDTMSFYTEIVDDGAEPTEAETFFGTCDLTGMRGSLVPCLYLDNDGQIQSGKFGEWLVGSVLGKLAGAF